ncbi:MAG: ribonuclease P protein component [Planctomycetota bacterium]
MTAAREGLPKRSRIAKRREFEQVFADGARVTSPELRLVGRPNGLDFARLGLAVGLRVSRRAVVRNQVKRRLREIFRRHRTHFLAGNDYILVAFAPAATLDCAQLREVLLRLAEKYARRIDRNRDRNHPN